MSRTTPCTACTPLTRLACPVCKGTGKIRVVRFTGLGAPHEGPGPRHLRRRPETGEPERAPGDEGSHGCVWVLLVGGAGIIEFARRTIEVLA